MMEKKRKKTGHDSFGCANRTATSPLYKEKSAKKKSRELDGNIDKQRDVYKSKESNNIGKTLKFTETIGAHHKKESPSDNHQNDNSVQDFTSGDTMKLSAKCKSRIVDKDVVSDSDLFRSDDGVDAVIGSAAPNLLENHSDGIVGETVSKDSTAVCKKVKQHKSVLDCNKHNHVSMVDSKFLKSDEGKQYSDDIKGPKDAGGLKHKKHKKRHKEKETESGTVAPVVSKFLKPTHGKYRQSLEFSEDIDVKYHKHEKKKSKSNQVDAVTGIGSISNEEDNLLQLLKEANEKQRMEKKKSKHKEASEKQRREKKKSKHKEASEKQRREKKKSKHKDNNDNSIVVAKYLKSTKTMTENEQSAREKLSKSPVDILDAYSFSLKPDLIEGNDASLLSHVPRVKLGKSKNKDHSKSKTSDEGGIDEIYSEDTNTSTVTHESRKLLSSDIKCKKRKRKHSKIDTESVISSTEKDLQISPGKTKRNKPSNHKKRHKNKRTHVEIDSISSDKERIKLSKPNSRKFQFKVVDTDSESSVSRPIECGGSNMTSPIAEHEVLNKQQTQNQSKKMTGSNCKLELESDGVPLLDIPSSSKCVTPVKHKKGSKYDLPYSNTKPVRNKDSEVAEESGGMNCDENSSTCFSSPSNCARTRGRNPFSSSDVIPECGSMNSISSLRLSSSNSADVNGKQNHPMESPNRTPKTPNDVSVMPHQNSVKSSTEFQSAANVSDDYIDGKQANTHTHTVLPQNLEIDLSWPLSPLHVLSMSMVITDEHKEKLKDEGVNFKQGRWTKQEENIILRNWAAFQKEYKVTDATSMFSLDKRHDNVKRKFMLYLGRDLDNRSLISIWQKSRQLLSDKQNTGRCSPEELDNLKSLVEIYGFRWHIIGKKMSRNPDSLQVIYRRMYHKLNSGKWTSDEDDKLLEIIFDLVGAANFNSENKNIFYNLPWGKVGNLHGTRNEKQCRDRWTRTLCAVLDPNANSKWNHEKTLEFLQLLRETKYENSFDVNWVKLAKELRFVSPSLIQMKWYRLKHQFVGGVQDMTFRETLDFIFDCVASKFDK